LFILTCESQQKTLRRSIEYMTEEWLLKIFVTLSEASAEVGAGAGAGEGVEAAEVVAACVTLLALEARAPRRD
jgi:hypothetical protein